MLVIHPLKGNVLCPDPVPEESLSSASEGSVCCYLTKSVLILYLWLNRSVKLNGSLISSL